jgi:hypothetical protein
LLLLWTIDVIPLLGLFARPDVYVMITYKEVI